MSHHPTPRRAHTGRTFVRSRLASAAVLALAAGGAQAMEIETWHPDLTVRWDNTVRVNLGARVEGRSSKIGNTAIADEGTYSFDKGDFVAKRIDLLSELDVVWQKRYGVRVSGAGWYDAAYGEQERVEPERAAGQHPELHRQRVQRHDQAPVPGRHRRAARRLRLRRRRPRRRAGAGQARPPYRVLGRVAAARRQPARHRLFAEPARPAEGLRHARHRGQGAVPAAEPAVGAGPGDRRPVGRGAGHARVGAGALSRGRHLPRPGRLRLQRPRPPVPLARPRLRHARRRCRAEAARRVGPVGALEPRRGSTARWASTTASSRTSCRRCCSPRRRRTPASTT